MNENIILNIRGQAFTFIRNEKTENFFKDAAAVAAILNKPDSEITAADRAKLLTIYHPAWHTSGKIAPRRGPPKFR